MQILLKQENTLEQRSQIIKQGECRRLVKKPKSYEHYIFNCSQAQTFPCLCMYLTPFSSHQQLTTSNHNTGLTVKLLAIEKSSKSLIFLMLQKFGIISPKLWHFQHKMHVFNTTLLESWCCNPVAKETLPHNLHSQSAHCSSQEPVSTLSTK